MAHSSTKVWAEANNGLKITEVATILGEQSNDLGTLCRSNNINVWAKHKPTKFSSVAPNPASNPKQWQGNNGLCGFAGSLSDFIFENFRTGVPSNSFLDLLMNNSLQWVYEKPTGGTGVLDSPYRLLDFDGYITNAVNPTGTMPTSVRGFHNVTPNPNTLTVTFPNLSADNLQMTDIGTGQGIGGEDFKVEDFYFGVVVYNTAKNKFACGTSTTQIKNISNNTVTITVYNMRDVLTTDVKANTVKIVPFFSSVEFHDYTHSTTGDAPEGIFLSAFTSQGTLSTFYIEDARQRLSVSWNDFMFDASEAEYVNSAYADFHIDVTDDDLETTHLGIAEYDLAKITNHSYDLDNDIIIAETIDSALVHPTTEYEQDIQYTIGDLYGLIESGVDYVFVIWSDNALQEASPKIVYP